MSGSLDVVGVPAFGTNVVTLMKHWNAHNHDHHTTFVDSEPFCLILWRLTGPCTGKQTTGGIRSNAHCRCLTAWVQ